MPEYLKSQRDRELFERTRTEFFQRVVLRHRAASRE